MDIFARLHKADVYIRLLLTCTVENGIRDVSLLFFPGKSSIMSSRYDKNVKVLNSCISRSLRRTRIAARLNNFQGPRGQRLLPPRTSCRQ